MNLDEMSEQEKSVMLARLRGWRREKASIGVRRSIYGKGWRNCSDAVWIDEDGNKVLFGVPNLYDPANMALAWRALNWAEAQDNVSFDFRIYKLFSGGSSRVFIGLPPKEAQSLWLDKILELAHEAGLLEDVSQ